MLAGSVQANRSHPAWSQTYRALQHTTERNRCRRDTINRFPADIRNFAKLFVSMQVKRHRADYDPGVTFRKSDVIQDIDEAEDAIKRFNEALRSDRRSFAIYVLLDIRND